MTGTSKKAPQVVSESRPSSESREPSSPSRKKAVKSSPAKAKITSTYAATVVEEEAQFFEWDLEIDGFVSAFDGVLQAKVVERTSNDYNYWLVATSEEGDLIMHKIASDMNPRWSPKTQSLTWNYYNNGTYGSWALQFTLDEAYESFKTAFARASWETLHRTPFNKIKVSANQSNCLSITHEWISLMNKRM